MHDFTVASLSDQYLGGPWVPLVVFMELDEKGLIVLKELFGPNLAMVLADTLGITNDML